MATGTVQFQSATLASPPAALAVMADAVNDASLGAGSAQYVKIMDGAISGTAKASVTTANGLAVDVTRVQGTVQTLGSIQGVGTFQVLGSVQSVGTTQTKDVRTVANPFGTRIPAQTTGLIVLASNASRLGASFYVESGSALYLLHGSSPGTFNYTVQVNAGALYELPFGYAGTVSGIWAFASGTLMVTENT